MLLWKLLNIDQLWNKIETTVSYELTHG